MGQPMGRYDENSNGLGRGERCASFVDDYLRAHPGLSLGELAFRLKADKRDLQRLLRDRSVGHPLEDRLHGYFGRLFGEHVYGALWGSGPSKRELELDIERAAIAARRERLERDRAECRSFRADPGPLLRMASDEGGRENV